MIDSRQPRSSTTKIPKVGELSLLDLTSPLLIPGEAPESGPAIGEVKSQHVVKPLLRKERCRRRWGFLPPS